MQNPGVAFYDPLVLFLLFFNRRATVNQQPSALLGSVRYKHL